MPIIILVSQLTIKHRVNFRSSQTVLEEVASSSYSFNCLQIKQV